MPLTSNCGPHLCGASQFNSVHHALIHILRKGHPWHHQQPCLACKKNNKIQTTSGLVQGGRGEGVGEGWVRCSVFIFPSPGECTTLLPGECTTMFPGRCTTILLRLDPTCSMLRYSPTWCMAWCPRFSDHRIGDSSVQVGCFKSPLTS